MIADLIRQAAAQLREAGIETPEHDAKLLLAEAVDAELRDIDKAMLMGEGLDSLAPAGGGCRAATGGGLTSHCTEPPSVSLRSTAPASGSTTLRTPRNHPRSHAFPRTKTGARGHSHPHAPA